MMSSIVGMIFKVFVIESGAGLEAWWWAVCFIMQIHDTTMKAPKIRAAFHVPNIGNILH